jgi:3-methylfumaryl-CoA hydratase
MTWSKTWTPDPVSLFRYSALTFNPHRIHYDRPYATQVEGFPGLVVHGPFSQQCLLDLLRDNTSRPLVRFEMRARAPLFDVAPFTTVGRMTNENEAELYAVGPSGGIAMQARATLG